MEKMASDGPKWGREAIFPANPDPANILGRTDLDFEKLCFFFDSLIPNFRISSFPDFQNLVWDGRGFGPWALGLGPGLLEFHTWSSPDS